jgi:hypothetical protein
VYWRLALFLCCAVPLGAQGTSVTVAYEKTLTFPVAGATAAFSLNSHYVEASAVDGVVTVIGKNPGSTNIVVITRSGTVTFEVIVPQPPPSYPPGFVKPQGGPADETASYEFRYSTGPSQQQNLLDLSARQGDVLRRLHIVNANLFGTDLSRDRVSFPSAFYTYRSPQREYTILDDQARISPLVAEGILIRGLHWREGRWIFHGGFSSISTFQNLFLPIEREALVGGGYRQPVGSHGGITTSFYALPLRSTLSAISRTGVIGSLMYEYKPREELSVLGELGVSRGLGGAFQIFWRRTQDDLRARVRAKPRTFATLGAGISAGLLGDLQWTHTFSPRFTADLMLTENRFRLRNFEQDNRTATLTLRQQLDRHWSLLGGAGYAEFRSVVPVAPRVATKNLPAGISFGAARFGGSFQYQYSRTQTRDLGGHQFRATAQTSFGRLFLTAYADRQTQAPSVSYIFSEIQGLQEILERLGLTATTPQQIADLLRDNAALIGLGFLEASRVNLNPERVQLGASLTYTSQRATRYQQLALNFLYNQDLGLNRTFQSAVYTATYSRKLSDTLDLFTSYSLFRAKASNAPSIYRPQFQISVRRKLAGFPNLLLGMKRGTVAGIVFRDDFREGRPRPGSAGIAPDLAEVEVVLDGERRVVPDRLGGFRFTGVRAGKHRLEVLVKASRPFYFTTPSSQEVEINSSVQVGIGFANSRLFGYVRNDAGAGIGGVTVVVSRGPQRYTAQTDADGKFTLTALPAGEYQVALNPESFGPGYLVENLAAASAPVSEASPAQLEFQVRAIRSFSGRASVYDRALARQVGVAGLRVRLVELDREAVTDGEGVYLFRDLPAGVYTVALTYEGREFTRTVTLPAGPAFPRDVDFNLGAR